jgi:hypothetical protein
MRIDLSDVSKGASGAPLPPTSLTFETGSVTIAEAEGGDRPVVLALIASGRMHPDTGSVTIDGVSDPALLRERVALVDAPEVSDPPADLPLHSVVREELAYAGRPANRGAVERAIADALHANDEAGITDELRTPHELVRLPLGSIPSSLRLRLLAELAASRPGVQALVLTLPDRHGGPPTTWHTMARDLAARDFAVLTICGAASAQLLTPTRVPSPSPTSPIERTQAAGEGSGGSGVVGVLGLSPQILHPQRPTQSPLADPPERPREQHE